MEPLTISRIDCPELPEKERWRVARGEHTVATFATRADAEAFLARGAEPHRHEDCHGRCFSEDELGVERCCYDDSILQRVEETLRKSRALRYRTQPPIVLGGQGRTGDELVGTASFLSRLTVFVILVLFCLACWALVARLVGWI